MPNTGLVFPVRNVPVVVPLLITRSRIKSPMLPVQIAPMLLHEGRPFSSTNDKYVFEIKWDGIRCIVFRDPDGVRLQSRLLNEKRRQFPEIVESADALPPGTVLDGELVVLDEQGKADMAAMKIRNSLTNQHKIKIQSSLQPATFVAFDLLYHAGENVMDKPLRERRKLLEQIFRDIESPRIMLSPTFPGEEGEALFDAIREQQIEGVVAKRLDSTYIPGKRPRNCWLKIKV